MPASTGAASASPAAQTASTTAIGRPPMAAMSETLTMTPHQPANHGSPRHELVHEAFDREQQKAVAVRDCRTVIARRDRACGRQSELSDDCGNVVLRRKAAARPQLGGKVGEGDGAEHQAAFFGNDRNPISASAIGG